MVISYQWNDYSLLFRWHLNWGIFLLHIPSYACNKFYFGCKCEAHKSWLEIGTISGTEKGRNVGSGGRGSGWVSGGRSTKVDYESEGIIAI